MENGWIKLYRKTLNNPIVCKDSDHLAVWIYLLLNAAHKEYPAVFLGKKITLLPGQLITGRKAIAVKLNIHESKVQRILKSFEIEQQIEQQNGNRNRLITILSWSDYQSSEHQDEQPVNNKRTTDEQQMNTNKNVRIKELKNGKKGTSSSRNKPKVYSEDDAYYQMALYFHEKVMQHAAQNNKAHLVENANLQKWADEFRKIIEIDKRNKMELKQVIDWATTDLFWQRNILSPSKLREKYVDLAMKMDEPRKYPSRQNKHQEQLDLLRQIYEEEKGIDQSRSREIVGCD